MAPACRLPRPKFVQGYLDQRSRAARSIPEWHTLAKDLLHQPHKAAGVVETARRDAKSSDALGRKAFKRRAQGCR